MKHIFTAFILFFTISTKAQIGIGTSTPDASAKLEVNSTSKGLLIPQISLTRSSDATTIASPATSLLVYNTATTSDVTPGYYYNAGTTTSPSWLRLNTGASGVPYSGATGAVNLGAYDLTVNGITLGKGAGNISTNTASGYQTLNSNTTGSGNIASGYQALYSNTTGSQNLASGFNALRANTTGNQNTASGYNTLRTNTTGNYNTAYGFQSLYANTSGNSNIGSGYQALFSNTTGNNNIAMGQDALYSNTTGSQNIAIGKEALRTNTTGTYNTAIGFSADVATNNLSNATAIGNGAIVAASNTIQLGNTSVTDVKTSGTITAGTVTYPSTHGTANQVLSTTGSGTLTWTTPTAYVPYTGATGAVNLGAYDLTVNGITLGTGAGNISSNTASGYQALNSNTTGSYNTASGYQALYSNTSGYLGFISANTASGYRALYSNTSGYYNTAMGVHSLYSNTTGSENIAIGHLALYSNTTGLNNTVIGSSAGYYFTSGYNCTMIGYNATASTYSISNEITLGNSSITSLRCNTQTITSLSDRRDKTDITPIVEGLAFLKQLNPVSFTWNTRDKAKVGIKSAGFIAQELLALQKQSNIGVNLDLVSENNPEKLEARYGNLLPVIVKAIQEESAEKDLKIKALNEKLDALEKDKVAKDLRLDALEKQITQMLKK